MKKIVLLFISCLCVGTGIYVLVSRPFNSGDQLPGVSEGADLGSRAVVEGDRAGVVVPAAQIPTRDVAASATRSPKSEHGLEEFQRRSDARWLVKRNKVGLVTKLSEGSFSLGTRAAVVGGERFLKEFAPNLLGVDKSSLQLEKNLQEEHAAQLVYEQIIHGLPVFGSRLSLFIDREGNLVHLSAELFQGEPPAKRGLISPADAAKIVRAALIDRLENECGVIESSAYPLSEFENNGVLGFRLQRGNVTFVYRYELVLQGDHHGSYEAMVDASEGQLVLFRDLNRK